MIRSALLRSLDVVWLYVIPGLGELWLQMQTPEMFIPASGLAQNDCSNTVWRWGNSSGQNKLFDQAFSPCLCFTLWHLANMLIVMSTYFCPTAPTLYFVKQSQEEL